MKRPRESTKEEEEKRPLTNYLFSTITIQDILLLIIKNLDVLVDLLNFYRILYRNFYDNDVIIDVLESYLLKTYGSIFDVFNDFLFFQKKEKMSNLPLSTYTVVFNKYTKFRCTKNFVKYGLCIVCGQLNRIGELWEIENYDKIELQSNKIYNCTTCKKLDGLDWFNPSELLHKIDQDDLCFFLSNKCNVRRIWNVDSDEYNYCCHDLDKITTMIYYDVK